MSYHLGPSPAPIALAPSVQPHHYPLLPLSQAPSALATGMDPGTKRLLIIIGILLLAIIVFSMLSKKKTVTRNRAPVKRLSTPDLAKNLYERLERRGNANEATMRSLKAYASKR